MARLKAQFRGLNTDLPISKLPSGSAREALNVTVANGRVAKRMGFATWIGGVNSTTGILFMYVARFEAAAYLFVKLSGGTFWQRQVWPASAASFTQIATTNGHTHDGSEPGFAFMWAERLIYGDNGGVSQWNPFYNSGVMVKAGLPKPARGATLSEAANGEKDGFYHCHYAWYDSLLDVEGVVSEPSFSADGSGGPTETRIEARSGGLSFAHPDLPTGYECTGMSVYSTMGNTEMVEVNGVQRETFSWRAAMDVRWEHDAHPVGGPGMTKADQSLDWTQLFTNEGGEPPPSTVGCWTGAVAVYGAGFAGVKATATYTSTNGTTEVITITTAAAGYFGNRIRVRFVERETPNDSPTPIITTATDTAALNRGGILITVDFNPTTSYETTTDLIVSAINADATASLWVLASSDGDGIWVDELGAAFLAGGVDALGASLCYSKFGRPTMVPQLATYQASTDGGYVDIRTITPRGGHHVIPSPIAGGAVAMCAAGGTAVVYGSSSTWVMRSTPDGHLYAVQRHGGLGCTGPLATAAFGFEVHAMANRAWTVTTAMGFQDISAFSWSTTLAEIPVTHQDEAVMAGYLWADQIWCAVASTAAGLARRILVLDKSAGSDMMIFEPASGLWATGEAIAAMCEMAYRTAEPTMLIGTNKGRILYYPATTAGDVGKDYPANWRGVYGTERGQFGQRLERLEIQAGDNCRGRLKWTAYPKRASSDSPEGETGFVEADNAINTIGLSNKPDARFWEIDLSSEAQADTETATAWEVEDMTLLLGRTDMK